MPGVGLAYCGPPETHHFFVQAIEKENKLFRKEKKKLAGGSGPLEGSSSPKQVAAAPPPVHRVAIPVPETPPELGPYFPRLTGRDPASFSKFLLEKNPVRMHDNGRLDILPELTSASLKHREKVHHISDTARNFSQGHRSLTAADLKLEKDDYMQSFNSDICASKTEHRRKYKEFTLMADAATRSKIDRYTLSHLSDK